MKLLAIIPALALAGCANPDYAQYSKAQTDIATARHAADAAKYRAMSDIAASGDSGAKIAAVMAMALGGGQSGGQAQIAAPQPNQALQWASILVPGLTQVAGMRYNYLSQQTQSNNATALGISTNGAFVGIAGKIQAPAATVTTDNSQVLSGVGTLGSGAYTDRHDVTSPIVQIVPTVVQPTVIQPVFAPSK